MFIQLSIVVLTLICIYSLGMLVQRYFFYGDSCDLETAGILGFIGWSIIGGILFLVVDSFLISKIVFLIIGMSIIVVTYHFVKIKVQVDVTKKTLYVIGVFAFFALIVANLTNVGDSSLFDTGAYHVVLVKWLKEYGVVTGIANLDLTYGAFSPVFILGALFESVSNTENSWKILNGVVYLIHVAIAISLFIKRDSRRELGVLLGYIFVLFFSRGYIASLSPDLWINLAIPYSLLLFSRTFESGQNSLLLLFVFTTFTLWVKLSSLPLLLLPLFSILYNRKVFHDKKLFVKTGIWITVLGLLYTTYNLLISGYLLYPISFTGIPFDWTVPVERVDAIRNHIYLWGINPSYDHNVNYDGFWWLEDWFIRNFNPHLYRNELLVFPIIIVGLFAKLFKEVFYNSKSFADKMYQICAIGLFFAGFIFWLYGSPNLRFFSPWIWTYAGIVLFSFLEILAQYFSDARLQNKILKYSMTLILLYLAGHMAIESGVKSKLFQDGMWFKTYERNEVSYNKYVLDNGQKVNIPTESKQPWYIPLPSSRQWPVYATGTIENGFKPTKIKAPGTEF